jgi:hypothetical protein
MRVQNLSFGELGAVSRKRLSSLSSVGKSDEFIMHSRWCSSASWGIGRKLAPASTAWNAWSNEARMRRVSKVRPVFFLPWMRIVIGRQYLVAAVVSGGTCAATITLGML